MTISETRSANISRVRAALSANPVAASAHRTLYQQYVAEIIKGAVAGFTSRAAEREAANLASTQAEAAARALIVGLLLDSIPTEYDQWAAREAATDYNLPYFDPKALFVGTNNESQRVFISLEDANAYTAQIAPERVLVTIAGTTLYLFSEADAEIFSQRTGLKLRPYHTI